MKILIATVGSHGDVLPFISIGEEMTTRGHEVTLYANEYFRDRVTDAGMRFVPVGGVGEYRKLFGKQAESEPRKAFRRIAQHFAAYCMDYYQALRAAAIPGQTVTIGSSLTFSHRLLRETHKIPCATVHLAPAVFRSNVAPARLEPNWVHAESSALAKRLAWWAADVFFYNPNFTKPLNRLRTEIGLPPLRHIFRSWIHEADCLVGMFPRWFAAPQPDWPSNVVLAGFPLPNSGRTFPLPDDVANFIGAGPAPIAFSVGTANAGAKGFFEAAAEACQLSKRRGIFLSHFPNQIPPKLPGNVMHVDYIPFESLLPKAAAFFHHGGIGSTSQALRAGIPQLIRPVAYDQFDNAARAVSLGVARELLPKHCSAGTIAKVLDELINDAALHRRCSEVAARLEGCDATGAACDAILSVASETNNRRGLHPQASQAPPPGRVCG